MLLKFVFIILSVHVIVHSCGRLTAQLQNSQDETEKKHKNELLLEKLGELAKTDPESFLLWNITTKYYMYDDVNISEYCVAEIARDIKLLPFYLVNRTIFVAGFQIVTYQTRHYYRENRMSDVNVYSIHKNKTMRLKDHEIYLSTIESMVQDYVDSEKDNICISESACGCFSKSELEDYRRQLARYREHTDSIWNHIIFKSYIEIFFRVLIMIIGMIFNCTLLLIFVKEKVIRTESNIMIIHLAISNVVMLLLYIPSNYVSRYVSYSEGGEFTAIEIFSVSLNTLTILFLNVHRYFQVSKVLENDPGCVSNPLYRCVIYVAVLWTWSILTSLFIGLIDDTSAVAIELILCFVGYVFIFSILMSIFNSLTARKLHRAAKEGRNPNDLKYVIGSGVVLSLTVSYYATHIPFYIYRVFEAILYDLSAPLLISTTSRVIIFFLHITFFLYPCVNVIVLYKASGAYRTFINKYLLPFWYIPTESKYITMSSVNSIEPEE